MRGFRSTLILLVVLVGLVAYIYYGLRPGKDEPAAAQKTKVFAVGADTITQITVRGTSGHPATVARENGVWMVTAPERVRADDTEASALVTNLASLEIQRVIDEQATDMGQYGLSPARFEVSFTSSADAQPRRLELGDKTATGADLYARLPGSNRVFLVSSFVEGIFNRTPFDLRDKSVLAFDRDKADRLEIQDARLVTTFVKTSAQWRVTSPGTFRADNTSVDGLVGRLKTSPMKAVVAAQPTPEQLATFGLTHPALTATVAVGPALATLRIGSKSPEGDTYYAQDAGRAMVFTVEAALIDDLRKPAAEYRPKDVFDFRPFMATRIEFTRNGSVVVLTKTTGKDGKDTWSRQSPAGAVDAGKVDAALLALANLQAMSYANASTNTGTQSPALSVVVAFGDPTREDRITFGRVGTDVFAVRAGEPGAATVEAAKFDEALAAIDALK